MTVPRWRFGLKSISLLAIACGTMKLMTVQTFRELLGQRPFRPFRLVMSSGQSYDVRHPEMAMLTKTDMLVGTDLADDGVPAEFRICPLLHVATIEPLSAPSAK
jgi:hypothetical protein